MFDYGVKRSLFNPEVVAKFNFICEDKWGIFFQGQIWGWSMFKLIFFVPDSHLSAVKEAVFFAGGGKAGLFKNEKQR